MLATSSILPVLLAFGFRGIRMTRVLFSIFVSIEFCWFIYTKNPRPKRSAGKWRFLGPNRRECQSARLRHLRHCASRLSTRSAAAKTTKMGPASSRKRQSGMVRKSFFIARETPRILSRHATTAIPHEVLRRKADAPTAGVHDGAFSDTRGEHAPKESARVWSGSERFRA